MTETLEWVFNAPVYYMSTCDECGKTISDGKMWIRRTWFVAEPSKRVLRFHPKCGKKYRRRNG